MPFNGSGTFTRPYSWITEANNGQVIDATKMDLDANGFADGLSNAITRDGQSVVTSPIPFNGQRLTGLGDAVADTDGLNRRSSDARNVRQIGGALSPSLSVAASTIDLSTGRSFYKTVSGDLTWVFSNPAATGNLDGFLLELTNGGTGTQTWPASVKWPSDITPSLTTAGVDLLMFITRDGGITWRGKLAMRDSR